MQFKDGCKVFTADGKDLGRIDRVVMDPRTKMVTHLVVRKGFLLTEDKLVPVELVASATPERVDLNRGADLIGELSPFEETHYVLVDDGTYGIDYETGYARPIYGYPPFGMGAASYAAPAYIPETRRNIAEDQVVVKEGAEVFSADDHLVGRVERVVTDPRSDQVTHFIISKGLLNKDRKVIPVQWVKEIDDRQIYLAVEARLVQNLKNDQEAKV